MPNNPLNYRNTTRRIADMTIREIEISMSTYIVDWANARIGDWWDFYYSENSNRLYGIYRLPNGNDLLDFLYSLVMNVRDHYLCEERDQLIPLRFASCSELIRQLYNFDKYIDDNYGLVESHFCGVNTNYVYVTMAQICHEIKSMISRCLKVYYEDDSMPAIYLQTRQCLLENNIEGFIDKIASIIEKVPYSVHKEKVNEGYFHTLFHVITSTIGLDMDSEIETNEGRIDVCIKTPTAIFIFEFKWSPRDKDKSMEALKQIKDTHYDQRYHTNCKPIWGIGVSFGKTARNINGWISELLYEPSLNLK